MSNSKRDAAIYREGAMDAMALYAWWKDGVQFVGTSGRTLLEAVRSVDQSLPAPEFDEDGNPIGTNASEIGRMLGLIGRGNRG